ncbi:hypothetical protein QZH41_007970 [Actinostola sp. cb2023]|nr:hypothetical protein QZH41_001195 [Actinostola sp. cb2023]KAK3731077.1 hypothetical protein QZH41_007970 [Actinostola sp. cb2023]
MNMFEMYIEATVRGYHAYLDNASVRIGEILTCEMEHDNPHDKYAVAVKNQDGNLVGHVPKELSRLFYKFLNDSGELEAECIGNRLNAGKGKGVEIPVDYRLVANHSYLEKLKRKLSTKDFSDNINISKIQQITETR